VAVPRQQGTVACQWTSSPSDNSWEALIQNLTGRLNEKVTLCSSEGDAFRWPDPATNYICPYSLSDFLERVHKYSLCSQETFVVGLVLIDRWLKTKEADGTGLSQHNLHLVAIIAIIVASKINDDKFVSNKRYAMIAGQLLGALNDMETMFLQQMDFRLHCTPPEYQRYANILDINLDMNTCSTLEVCDSKSYETTLDGRQCELDDASPCLISPIAYGASPWIPLSTVSSTQAPPKANLHGASPWMPLSTVSSTQARPKANLHGSCTSESMSSLLNKHGLHRFSSFVGYSVNLMA